jgi:hypothetical protein
MPAAITHDKLLRTMDALMENADAVEERVAAQLRPMLDQQLCNRPPHPIYSPAPRCDFMVAC